MLSMRRCLERACRGTSTVSPEQKEGESVKASAMLAFAVIAVATGMLPAQAQTCSTGICAGRPAGSSNHDLFIEREYRDFLQQRYPNYGSRYRGRAPDIGIGPGATVGGPSPRAVDRSRLRQRQRGQFDANAHLRWCQERYASYRAADDTFQPFDGGRRRCNSPYN